MAKLRKSCCELYQQLEGLHVNIGDDALLGVLHHQLHKVRTPGSKNHLVDVEHLLLTQELVVRQLASLEHGQQGGVAVVKQRGFLLRQLILLLHLFGFRLIGPSTVSTSDQTSLKVLSA